MSSNEDVELEDEDLDIVVTDFAAIQPNQYEPMVGTVRGAGTRAVDVHGLCEDGEDDGEDDDDDDYIRNDTENAVLHRSTQAASEW